MEWLDIDTAPRGGTMFLINDAGDVYLAWYTESRGRNGTKYDLHFIDNVKPWNDDGDLDISDYVIKPNAYMRGTEKKIMWAEMPVVPNAGNKGRP